MRVDDLIGVIRDPIGLIAPPECYGMTAAFFEGVEAADPARLGGLRRFVHEVYTAGETPLAWHQACLLDLVDRETRVALDDCGAVAGSTRLAFQRMEEVLRRYVAEGPGADGEGAADGEPDDGTAETAAPAEGADDAPMLASAAIVQSMFERPAMYTGRSAFRNMANLFSGGAWARPDLYPVELVPGASSPALTDLPWSFRVLSPELADERIAELIAGDADAETEARAFSILERVITDRLAATASDDG